METNKNSSQRILIILLKDLSRIHTATSLSKELKMSRWGIWKILKKLEEDHLIILESIGTGKTSIQTTKLNWDNVLVEKTLVLSLTKEALKYKRWMFNFKKLEREVEFLILFGSILQSSKKAGDIDVICIAKEKNISRTGDIILGIQQTQNKKIHSINFTKKELKQELKEKNKAYIDAIKKGIVLYGQEKFINFMREKGYLSM